MTEPEGRLYPFVVCPLDTCYCSRGGSLETWKAVRYCGGSFEECEIFRKETGRGGSGVRREGAERPLPAARPAGEEGDGLRAAVSQEDAPPQHGHALTAIPRGRQSERTLASGAPAW